MRSAELLLLTFLVALCGCKRQEPDATAALLEAASRGAYSQVGPLVRQGADINARDHHEQTPLHLASWSGHVAMIGTLLVHGADPDADSPFGRPIHIAIQGEHMRAVAKLIAGRADVNLSSTYPKSRWGGYTPLHAALCAPSMARDEMVEMLVAAGADPDLATETGNSALHLAAHDEYAGLVELFLRNGAEVNARNKRGATPLHVATWGNQTRVVQLLVDHGADVNTSDKVGDTPLHIAAANGYADLFALLEKHGADPQARNDLGQRPGDCLRLSDAADVMVLHADDRVPYVVIMTRPAMVRGLLLYYGIEFDRVWIPDRGDVEGVDLKEALDNSSHIALREEYYRDAVRQYLPDYNREYAGFLRGGRKYLICNATDNPSRTPPVDWFTMVMDGGCGQARIVVDLAEKVVTWIDCNGGQRAEHASISVSRSSRSKRRRLLAFARGETYRARQTCPADLIGLF